MDLINKIKNIFKKEESTEIEPLKILPHTKWKYEDLIVHAPNKSGFEGEDLYFYISLFDKNNKHITDETLEININGEQFKSKTNEWGHVKLNLNGYKPQTYPVIITYPNGDYSQILESQFKIRKKKDSPKKSAPKPVKKSDRKTSLLLPKMKMYVNNEGQYYVRLRDYKFKPIAGEELKIIIGDNIFRETTDTEGFIRLDIENLDAGKYEVFAEYEGSSKYDPTSKTSELEMLVREIDKEVVIEVENLTMEFKVTKDKIDTLKEFIIRTLKRNKEKNDTIRILDNISFKVYKGDKLGILGFNGAGKSTLLKIMSGIYEPTSGTIKTKGKIAPLLELGAGFDKNYTGKNNIFLNGALLSLDEKFIKEKYDEIVEFSELGDFINYPIKNYSSGMKTKLGFSIATLINPDILIVDEILSVGDIKFKKKSAEKINSMMSEGVTVLLVSHSISQMRKICDTCIWLENGKIKMYGEANEVCDAYVKGAKRDIKRSKNKK